MTDDQQMRDYLDEHLPYMLKMLRYSYGQMLQEQHYLSWNAHFESFAVHARNLVNFLTYSDTGNLKAHEFVRDFKARKGDIDVPMRKLEQQVFHLAKTRPKDAVGKFNSDHAGRVREWVEENFEDFRTVAPAAVGGRGAPRDVAEGADTAVWLALDAPATLTGKFMRDREVIPW